MSRPETVAATREAVRAGGELAAHLERLSQRMAQLLPASPDALTGWDDDPWERLHALLRMFEQLYDLTSRKLFVGFLELSGEVIAGLSARNQFRRVEALGGIDSADRWIELGATRNMLVHDYPTDPVARADRANRAWHDLPILIAMSRQVIAAIQREELV